MMRARSNIVEAKRDLLLNTLAEYQSCAVAYSGGVDSAVVAKAASIALGEHAIAVTAVSASLAAGELKQAAVAAQQIGIRHELLYTDELSNSSYIANRPDRCFHCKTELYTRLRDMANRLGFEELANGSNVDDLGDYRPGHEAATIHGVRSPLVDCRITKADVRAFAAVWQLSAADKPASPCLSSRIAYGEPVRTERLEMIDRAEQIVRALGISVCRVRFLAGSAAKVEVAHEHFDMLNMPSVFDQLADQLRALGFQSVALDPAGYRSGSMNEALELHQIDLGN